MNKVLERVNELKEKYNFNDIKDWPHSGYINTLSFYLPILEKYQWLLEQNKKFSNIPVELNKALEIENDEKFLEMCFDRNSQLAYLSLYGKDEYTILNRILEELKSTALVNSIHQNFNAQRCIELDMPYPSNKKAYKKANTHSGSGHYTSSVEFKHNDMLITMSLTKLMPGAFIDSYEEKMEIVIHYFGDANKSSGYVYTPEKLGISGKLKSTMKSRLNKFHFSKEEVIGKRMSDLQGIRHKMIRY